ncbi:MAG TPA: choice-of-anchor tandem repeat GloVer-containing protein, partial [Bacteroidia bacterium]|nr:choice-of-anchor tandem repeat GloVer-containing protein [Bacteroidia bacterium]
MKKILIVLMALFLQPLSMSAQSYALYGMTNFYSSIFKFDPVTHKSKTVFWFDTLNGALPVGSLMQASNGLLYGMTSKGGTHNKGVVFSFNPATNKEAVLVEFNGQNGEYPYGNLIQASNGLLYGMTTQGGTYNNGVIFSYNLSTGSDSVIFNFDSLVSGSEPWGTLMQASNGLIYGLTKAGGPIKSEGVLFGFDPANTASSF